MAPPEYGACNVASVRTTDVAVKTKLVHIAVGLVSAAHPNAKIATVAQRLDRPKREQCIGNTRSRISARRGFAGTEGLRGDRPVSRFSRSQNRKTSLTPAKL